MFSARVPALAAVGSTGTSCLRLRLRQVGGTRAMHDGRTARGLSVAATACRLEAMGLESLASAACALCEGAPSSSGYAVVLGMGPGGGRTGVILSAASGRGADAACAGTEWLSACGPCLCSGTN